MSEPQNVIPSARIPVIDMRTGEMTRPWYRYLSQLITTNSGVTTTITTANLVGKTITVTGGIVTDFS